MDPAHASPPNPTYISPYPFIGLNPNHFTPPPKLTSDGFRSSPQDRPIGRANGAPALGPRKAGAPAQVLFRRKACQSFPCSSTPLAQIPDSNNSVVVPVHLQFQDRRRPLMGTKGANRLPNQLSFLSQRSARSSSARRWRLGDGLFFFSSSP